MDDIVNDKAYYEVDDVKYFDTKFPDYVDVIPLEGARFDLQISGDN